MQPCGGGADHKKEKESSCERNVVQRCPLCEIVSLLRKVVFFSAPSLWGSGSSFQFCGYGLLRCTRMCWISSASTQIMPRALSASTSAFIHFSINQVTTFQCMVLYSYSIIQSTLTLLCPLFERKTHLFEHKTTPHSPLPIPVQLRRTPATRQRQKS